MMDAISAAKVTADATSAAVTMLSSTDSSIMMLLIATHSFVSGEYIDTACIAFGIMLVGHEQPIRIMLLKYTQTSATNALATALHVSANTMPAED